MTRSCLNRHHPHLFALILPAHFMRQVSQKKLAIAAELERKPQPPHVSPWFPRAVDKELGDSDGVSMKNGSPPAQVASEASSTNHASHGSHRR